MYKEWAYPYEKRFFDKINDYAKKYDGAVILHICGNTTKVLDLMADTGAPILEIDYKVDLAEARSIVGNRSCLLGNIHPIQVLLRGTPELVAEESRKCIESAGKDSGFILGSGCEVAVDTPLENTKAMVKAAREYSY